MKKMVMMLVVSSPFMHSALSAHDRVIWHDKPAKIWQSSGLSTGQWSLGAVWVFGGLKEERIQFNC